MKKARKSTAHRRNQHNQPEQSTTTKASSNSQGISLSTIESNHDSQTGVYKERQKMTTISESSDKPNYNDNGGSGSKKDNPNQSEDIFIDDKDLANHIKASRVNFIIHSMGQICRVTLMPSYKSLSIDYRSVDLDENYIVMEGIFVVVDTNSSNLILLQTEVFAVHKTTGEDKTIKFIEEHCKVSLENIAMVSFPGHNLTIDGPQKCKMIKHKSKKEGNGKKQQLKDKKQHESRTTNNNEFRSVVYKPSSAAVTVTTEDVDKAPDVAEKETEKQPEQEVEETNNTANNEPQVSADNNDNLIKSVQLNDPAILNIRENKEDSKAAKPPSIKSPQKDESQAQVAQKGNKNSKQKNEQEESSAEAPVASIWNKFSFDQKEQEPKRQKSTTTTTAEKVNKNKTNAKQQQNNQTSKSSSVTKTSEIQEKKSSNSQNKKKAKEQGNSPNTKTDAKTANTTTLIDAPSKQTNQTAKKGKRDLVKFYDAGATDSNKNQNLLESLDNTRKDKDDVPFDQFKQKGVKSTYDWEIYSTKLNKDTLTKDQVDKAGKISAELDAKEKQMKTCDAEVNESEEAQFSNVIRKSSSDVNEEQQQPMSLKNQLMAAMGAPNQQFDLLKLPANMADPRSRTNSLRNGETSKVIQNMNLDAGYIDKEQYEDYLNYKKSKDTVNNRKLSTEQFKEASKLLGERMNQKGIKPLEEQPKQIKRKTAFTCFNRQINNDNQQNSLLLVPYTKKMYSNLANNDDDDDELENCSSQDEDEQQDEIIDDNEENNMRQNKMEIELIPRQYDSLFFEDLTPYEEEEQEQDPQIEGSDEDDDDNQ